MIVSANQTEKLAKITHISPARGAVTWLRVLISAAVVWPRTRLRGKDSVEERAGFGAGRAVADLVGAEKAHLTTPSLMEYHAHPAIAGVPVAGLPQSRTALAWLTAGKSPAVRAFAEDAAQILDDSPGR